MHSVLFRAFASVCELLDFVGYMIQFHHTMWKCMLGRYYRQVRRSVITLVSYQSYDNEAASRILILFARNHVKIFSCTG